MKKILLLCLLFAAASCQRQAHFTVTGHITEAKDTVLYLEHITLGDGIVPIDSVRLSADGAFSLQGAAPENPEFYRLRIGEQGINLAVDSTETITVEAAFPQMSFGYSVEGSGACDTIRMLSLKLAELERTLRSLAANRDFTVEEREAKARELVQQYKHEVKLDFIQYNMRSASSYFACFQMLGGQLLFDPMHDKDDLKWVRAIANAWNEAYPDCPRTQNLANIIAEGRRNLAKPRELVLTIDSSKVSELGIVDMTFPDIQGNEVRLSSLRGHVVLLDFTAYGMQGSSERTLQLRELYEKYHERGLEVYQVSVDPDRHLWTQRCENLPWVCVFCEEGLNSDILSIYQVTSLPYYFLIDRNCDLQARQENIPDLEKAIRDLL